MTNFLDKYVIDENKFLVAINSGITFKTTFTNVSSAKQGSSIYFKQEFSYRFDTEFVANNEQKLLDLGVIIKKTDKEIKKRKS